MAVAASDLELTPSLDEVRELAARPHARAAAPHLHRRLRDARVRLPEAARRRPVVPARVGRAGPAAWAAGRSSASGPRAVIRLRSRRAPATRTRLVDEELGPLPDRAARRPAAVRRRRGRAVRLRPRAQRRADRRRAEPRRHRRARAGADGHRRAARLRPPAPRGHRAGQRGGRRTTWSAPTSEAAAAIADVRERLRGPGAAGGRGPARAARVRVQHRRRRLRRGGRARQGVHPRRRRLPGGAEPALERRLPGRRVLDLPRPARDQPEPVHVLPRLRGLRDRRAPRRSRSSRSPAAGRAAPDRRHAPARGLGRAGPRAGATSCWPTRRSAPST